MAVGMGDGHDMRHSNTYFDGDVVFAKVSHLDELVDAVDGQIALHICIQVPGGGHTDGMRAHHLKI